MTMLTVSICVAVAALVTLGAAKAATDARAKAAMVPVKAKRRVPPVASVLMALAVGVVGSALAYTTA